jgi:hypothetical protein
MIASMVDRGVGRVAGVEAGPVMIAPLSRVVCAAGRDSEVRAAGCQRRPSRAPPKMRFAFAASASEELRRGEVNRCCAQSMASPHRYSGRVPNNL